MQLTALIADDDAVSPVIGVILMVAITVILAAVIGAFVLGFGIGGDAAPQVTWDVDEQFNDSGDQDKVDLQWNHQGGDSVDLGNDDLSVTPSDLDESNSTDVAADGSVDAAAASSDDLLQAGDSFTVVYNDTDGVDPGDEVQLVWSPSGSDETSIVGTHTVSTSL